MSETEVKAPDNDKDLFTALCKAQLEYPDIPKTREGQIQNRKFMYADLSDIRKAVTPINSKHGLSITHRTAEGILYSSLIHAPTGQKITTFIKVPGNAEDLKSLGAAFTYLRRYNIQNLLDLAPDDDLDAIETKPQSTPVKPPAAPLRPVPPIKKHDPHPEDEVMTTLEYLVNLVKQVGIPTTEMPSIIKRVTGQTKTSSQLTEEELRSVIKYLEMKR